MGFGMFDSDRYDEDGNYDEDYHRSTGSMTFGPKMGTWIVHSNKDPRWNKSGRGMGLVSSGGPIEMRDWIATCIALYGDIPEDATKSFWKD